MKPQKFKEFIGRQINKTEVDPNTWRNLVYK